MNTHSILAFLNINVSSVAVFWLDPWCREMEYSYIEWSYANVKDIFIFILKIKEKKKKLNKKVERVVQKIGLSLRYVRAFLCYDHRRGV